jgi:hypothetical protein
MNDKTRTTDTAAKVAVITTLTLAASVIAGLTVLLAEVVTR